MLVKYLIVLAFLFVYLNGNPLLKLISPEGKEMWLLGLMDHGDIKDTLAEALAVIEKTKPIRSFAVEDFPRNVVAAEWEQSLGDTAPKVPAGYKKKVVAVTNFWPKGNIWENEKWKAHSLLYIHKLYIKHLEQHHVGTDNYVMAAETWIQEYLRKANPKVKTYNLEPTTPEYRQKVILDNELLLSSGDYEPLMGIGDYETLMGSEKSLDILLKTGKRTFHPHQKDAIKFRAKDYKLGCLRGLNWHPTEFFDERNRLIATTLVALVNKVKDEGVLLAAVGYDHLCGKNAVQKILQRDYHYTVQEKGHMLV